MARKSRKNLQNISLIENKQIYKVGIYVRLSVLDNNKKDSDTIQNQKNIILDYIKDKKEFKLVEIYEDNNKTGTNFNREGFKKLLEDIKRNKINCIIVKDLSRFGRNYIECGNYLERIFPFMNIRFIAINDNYDSNKDNSSEILIMHLKNIVNETYAKDISKKITTVFNEKQKKGEFIGSFASYGYIKSPENKNKLIINEETSVIVQKIFNLRLKGYSYNKIAKILNEAKILSPYAYLYSKGLIKNTKFKDNKWIDSTIKKILSNEVYIGNLVQGKYKTISIKNRKKVDKDNYIVVENTHQPIISKEVFHQVQKINEKSKKTYYENNEKNLIEVKENMLKNYIKCGECGKNLIRRTRINKTKSGESIYSFFECKSHRTNDCSFTTIKSNYVEEIILNEIKKQIEIFLNLKQLANKKTLYIEEDMIKNKIKNIENEINKIKSIYKKNYQNYLNEYLTEDEYIFNKNTYLKKENELLKTKKNLEHKLSNIKNNYILNIFNDDENLLNKRFIETLIEKVILYKDKKVYIFFNYNIYNKD